jgi:RNA polymerase sigma-70 factor (ECF subfamily)
VCADCPARLADDLGAAFPAFVEHHQDLVYGIARRVTRQAADAEDLAQETFLRAYRALAGYAPERRRELRTRGWLAAVTLNLGRNRARSRRGREPRPLDETAELARDERPGPELEVARRESARLWRARLDALPARYGRAVALRHVSGLSYPELAVALGRPVNTVKSDVHRGLALLRRALADEDEVKR